MEKRDEKKKIAESENGVVRLTPKNVVNEPEHTTHLGLVRVLGGRLNPAKNLRGQQDIIDAPAWFNARFYHRTADLTDAHQRSSPRLLVLTFSRLSLQIVSLPFRLPFPIILLLLLHSRPSFSFSFRFRFRFRFSSRSSLLGPFGFITFIELRSIWISIRETRLTYFFISFVTRNIVL